MKTISLRSHILPILVGLLYGMLLSAQSPVREGGGEYVLPEPTFCLSPQQRTDIRQEIDLSRTELRRAGLLPATPPHRGTPPKFVFPLRAGEGLSYFDFQFVSNYFDHDATASGSQYGDSNLDYNCGSHTYDRSNGYNHTGTDLATWPLPWYLYHHDLVEVVAAAAGTILVKKDGNFDRNCSFNNSSWNAVYLQHDDGSITWYGHLKSGSLTEKAIGERVEAGEYLGVVASSGNSTGPHLHFEVYDAFGDVVDPYAGSCNDTTDESWWEEQPDYKKEGLFALVLHDRQPEFGCPDTEEAAEVWDRVEIGATVFFTRYFHRDPKGTTTKCRILRPDGSSFSNWSSTSNLAYINSYWWTSRQIPKDAPLGTWTFEADYRGTTYSRSFEVTEPAAVKWLYVEGLVVGQNRYRIEWETKSEYRNAGFEVQRSTDLSEWTTLDFIPGNGTTERNHRYRYLDTGLQPGTYHYRLRQLNDRGEELFSELLSGTVGAPSTVVDIAPNPVRRTLFILGNPEAATIRVYDTTGRLVLRSEQTELDVSALSSGVYLVEIIETDGERTVKRMVRG